MPSPLPGPNLLPGCIVAHAARNAWTPMAMTKAIRTTRPTDTRRTLETFAWPPAVVSMVATAYLPRGDCETSPARITVGQRIDPKVP